MINPGSCGLPLDCIKDGIPYTILDVSGKEGIAVDERRVDFQKEEYIVSLMQSRQYEEVNIWSRIIIEELRTSREHLFFFLEFAEKYAMEIGDARRPFAASTWKAAFELWQRELKM